MASWILGLVVLLVAAPTAGQMCPGDNNADGVTTVDEIVAGVNAALNGCEPTPIPERCTLDFTRLRPTTEACVFTGAWYRESGADNQEILCGALTVTVTTPAIATVLVTLDTFPEISLVAQRNITSTFARLTSWWVSPSDPISLGGALVISDDRTSIDINPIGAPFAIDDCSFYGFRGIFVPPNSAARP